MNRYIITLIAFALFLFGGMACSQTIVFCPTCQSEFEFREFAEGLVSPVLSGEYQFEVVNPDSGQIYFVDVFVLNERETGTRYVQSELRPGTAAEKEDFEIVRGIFSLEEIPIAIPAPPEPGTESFRLHTEEGVNRAINASGELVQVATFVRRVNFWRALSELTGRVPIAVVVFPNGDVARFRITNPAGGVLCCQYIQGSARNSMGEPIDDSGFGGVPGPSGGDYVQPGGSGDGIFIVILELTTRTFIVECVSVGGVSQGCTIRPE